MPFSRIVIINTFPGVQKHAELVFLYNGRKMHAKALSLLQQYVSRPRFSIYKSILTNYVLSRP